MTGPQPMTPRDLMAHHVADVVATFPPMTDEQRALIVGLLSPSTTEPAGTPVLAPREKKKNEKAA